MRNLSHAAGFTLLELVVVVAIIALVAAVAIPRVSHARQQAAAASLDATTHEFQSALERYAIDHDDRPVVRTSAGDLVEDGEVIRAILTGNAGGLAYLTAIPPNPFTTCGMINVRPHTDNRWDCSWRIDPDLNKVRPDHVTGPVGSFHD